MRYKRIHQIEVLQKGNRHFAILTRDQHNLLTADAATEIKALNRLAQQARIPTFEQWRYQRRMHPDAAA